MSDNPDVVTVDLGQWADDVDRYAAERGLSRHAAVLALVRLALTGGTHNTVSGDVSGGVFQVGQIQGGVRF